jgi:serine/threonine protein kinase
MAVALSLVDAAFTATAFSSWQVMLPGWTSECSLSLGEPTLDGPSIGVEGHGYVAEGLPLGSHLLSLTHLYPVCFKLAKPLVSTAEQAVKQHGPQPSALVVHILRRLCGALREAHTAGLIHRDIKPSNVIVGERSGLRDEAKVLDFGIVDAPDADHGGVITAAGQPLGTPAYMSAEQAAGSTDLDARSDLYRFGATAYFMLTGQPPFDRPTIYLTIAAQLRDPVTPPQFLRPADPAHLSAILVRCLDKDPARRFQDAAELDRALATCKCADGWTDERPAQAAQSPPVGGEV